MFVGAMALNRMFFGELDFQSGPVDSPIYLDDLQCLGTELSLEDCVSDTGTDDCIHEFQDAGVLCQQTLLESS